MNKKIPLFCRIKRKSPLYIASPSAIFICDYGFKFRPSNWCMSCPKYKGSQVPILKASTRCKNSTKNLKKYLK